MPSEPPAPDSIPQYIIDGMQRQDKHSLGAIEQYAAELREYRLQQEQERIDESELADENEELVDVEEDSGGTTVIKKVPCGKNCSGCPHGPYKYVVERQGGDLEWEYIGPVGTSE